MRLPVIRGLIDRRILVNYQVDADVLARHVPAPFRPWLIRGVGLAGICLIRLKQVRPRGWPRWLGLSSENAAHRIAVEWEQDGQRRQGVYIPRRDTSLWLNSVAGGRLFPGVHHLADFDVDEQPGYRIGMRGRDGRTRLRVAGQVSRTLPATSVFTSLDDASAFFQAGAVGYSPASYPGCFDGLELQTQNWRMEPLAVTEAASSFFDDRDLFPEGAVRFDSAFLMRHIEHEWRSRSTIVAAPDRDSPADAPPTSGSSGGDQYAAPDGVRLGG